MPSYPSGVFAPATKNTNDTIQASHVNDLQVEVTALETALLWTIGHDITLSSGVITVAKQPLCHVWSTAAQSISSSQSTGTRLTFENIDYDIGGGWSTGTNLYTAPS